MTTLGYLILNRFRHSHRAKIFHMELYETFTVYLSEYLYTYTYVPLLIQINYFLLNIISYFVGFHNHFRETSADFPEPTVSIEKKKEIPDDLICSICKDLFVDAVMIPCCGSSFCDDCKIITK